jgi:pSer/pThr/pTyr-binding forkhead associated (FHA) protein
MLAVDDDNLTAQACLYYRDETGRQQRAELNPARSPLTIGRGQGSVLHLFWDTEVSRLHAQVDRVGQDWVLDDDGLSRNGTYINGERLQARRRLRDGDVILIGSTTMTFRADQLPPSSETKVARNVVTVVSLSETQRQIIQALCRPYKGGSAYAAPATNQQIADEIYLSVDSVKNHLRTLFHKFGVEELPQNLKRTRLVELAFRSGLVSDRNL